MCSFLHSLNWFLVNSCLLTPIMCQLGIVYDAWFSIRTWMSEWMNDFRHFIFNEEQNRVIVGLRKQMERFGRRKKIFFPGCPTLYKMSWRKPTSILCFINDQDEIFSCFVSLAQFLTVSLTIWGVWLHPFCQLNLTCSSFFLLSDFWRHVLCFPAYLITSQFVP